MPKAKRQGLAKLNKAISIRSRVARKKQEAVSSLMLSVKQLNHEVLGTTKRHIYRAELSSS